MVGVWVARALSQLVVLHIGRLTKQKQAVWWLVWLGSTAWQRCLGKLWLLAGTAGVVRPGTGPVSSGLAQRVLGHRGHRLPAVPEPPLLPLLGVRSRAGERP